MSTTLDRVRLLVARGEAFISRHGHRELANVLAAEKAVEKAVSDYLGKMEVVVLPIFEGCDHRHERSFIERNSIALLSNFDRPALDAPSQCWLGHQSGRDKVRRSGLWNNQHVDEAMTRTSSISCPT